MLRKKCYHTLHTTHLLSLFIFVCASCQPAVHSYPAYSTDGTELVVVEEIVHCTPNWCRNATNIQDNADNESVMDAVDDLIFLAKKPKQSQQQTAQQQQPTTSPNEQPQQHYPHQRTTAATYQPIDLPKTNTPGALAASAESSADSASLEHDFASGAEVDGDGDDDGVDVPHEIELRTDDSSAAAPLTPIDMSDFVSLIPAEKVKAIAANYYQHDAEVQRAYAYLRSADFAALKQHIIAVPEVAAFLRYLNNSGLDVMGFLHTLTNLTTSKAVPNATVEPNVAENANAVALPHEILSTEHSTTAAMLPAATTTTTTITEQPMLTAETTAVTPLEATTKQQQQQQQQQLNGLHGLVDSILDILPQDQILTTFFDKLESNEQFSKLVDNIGSPAFAKILSDMEKSVSLRNLIYSLHNNGIYITRIVDSLKAYFFLGGF